jgi:hypothetical protein
MVILSLVITDSVFIYAPLAFILDLERKLDKVF